MNCGFCHKEIPDKVGAVNGENACGSCFGGCRKIHCPYCGYANPSPSQLLSRLLPKKKDKTK